MTQKEKSRVRTAVYKFGQWKFSSHVFISLQHRERSSGDCKRGRARPRPPKILARP